MESAGFEVPSSMSGDIVEQLARIVPLVSIGFVIVITSINVFIRFR